MESQEIDALNTAGRLPSPKGVALRLLRLISSDTVSGQEIAQAIRSDPALAGRVIGAANTSAHHGQRAVVSVLEALARIGTAATCRLALGLSLIAEHRDGHCPGFDYQRYWARSLVMALTMQALARRTQAATPEELFTIGLLAEVGQLALATLHPDTYGSVCARVPEVTDIPAQVTAERNAYATDRFELAQTLLSDWGFPEIFLEMVALVHRDVSHDPAPGSRRYLLTYAMRVATRVADCAVDFDLRRDAAGDLATLGAALELAAEELQVVWNEVATAWPTWTRLLELDMPELSPLELSPRPTVAAEPMVPAEPPLRILAVTESAQVRHVLTTLFESANVTLRVAEGDEAALHAAVNDEPRIVIYEWRAASTHGLGFCRTLRRSTIGHAAYILVLGDRPGEGALVEALESGADDFMPWPSAAEVLGARVRVGQRIVALQDELARDRDEIRRYAADQAVATRRLKEVARSDPLTGLPNRRHAMDQIDAEWRSACKSGRPLSCLMIDVDNFKHINDTFGHAIGDGVLTKIAEVMRENARAFDTVFRVGGEEFLVVCCNTDRPAALACAERLRSVVQAAHIDVGGHRHPITISVGVATMCDQDIEDAPALLRRADKALYRAKLSGRNRVAGIA